MPGVFVCFPRSSVWWCVIAHAMVRSIQLRPWRVSRAGFPQESSLPLAEWCALVYGFHLWILGGRHFADIWTLRPIPVSFTNAQYQGNTGICGRLVLIPHTRVKALAESFFSLC